MDALAMPWANVRAAHLLAVWRMTPMEVGNGQEEGMIQMMTTHECILRKQKHWNLCPLM